MSCLRNKKHQRGKKNFKNIITFYNKVLLTESTNRLSLLKSVVSIVHSKHYFENLNVIEVITFSKLVKNNSEIFYYQIQSKSLFGENRFPIIENNLQ